MQWLPMDSILKTLISVACCPISVLDVIYGYGRQIEESGQDFYVHKTVHRKVP